MSSKIAEKISDAIHDSWTDPISIADVVDNALAGHTITRREVDQLRKDVETLKDTLAVVHVNLARAENEAATYKVANENNFHTALDLKVESKHWFDQTMTAYKVLGGYYQTNQDLRDKLWNTEKELNDLKKSLDVPPAQAAELQWNGMPKLNPDPDSWKFQYPILADASTWTATKPLEAGSTVEVNGIPCKVMSSHTLRNNETNSIFEAPESKSGGSVWVVLAIAGAIVTGGIVLIHYLTANL